MFYALQQKQDITVSVIVILFQLHTKLTKIQYLQEGLIYINKPF